MTGAGVSSLGVPMKPVLIPSLQANPIWSRWLSHQINHLTLSVLEENVAAPHVLEAFCSITSSDGIKIDSRLGEQQSYCDWRGASAVSRKRVQECFLPIPCSSAACEAQSGYFQPITRSDLSKMFGKEVSRDTIASLRDAGFIASGPRSPTPGAPYTYVTTKHFLSAFSLETLRDLPDVEALEDAGLFSRRDQTSFGDPEFLEDEQSDG
jgi:hypothetical protein